MSHESKTTDASKSRNVKKYQVIIDNKSKNMPDHHWCSRRQIPNQSE